MNHSCTDSKLDSCLHKGLIITQRYTYINKCAHYVFRQPRVVSVVQPGVQEWTSKLDVYQSVHVFTQPAPGLLSPLSLCSISPLVETLISCFQTTLCLSACWPVQVGVHLQPTVTHQINAHTNMLWVTLNSLSILCLCILSEQIHKLNLQTRQPIIIKVILNQQVSHSHLRQVIHYSAA